MIKEKIAKVLDGSWSVTKNQDGLYETDIYVDYQDEMDDNTAIEILESKDPKAFELLYAMAGYCSEENYNKWFK